MNRWGSRKHDEQGAVAVLVAGLALALLGAGAMAVDLGQVYAKRASLQKTVDLAVLAAAAELDGTNVCTSEAISAATSYLSDNWIDGTNDPIDVDLGGSATDDDGFMQCDGWEVELWAPKAHVNYGLARAVMPDAEEGDGINVPAYAKAGVFSPKGVGTMPSYAASGCDYGQQTLLDDSSPGPLPVPDLQEDSPIDSGIDIDLLDPDEIALNPVGLVPLRIEGNNRLRDATHVAFSTPEGGTNIHHEVTYTTREAGLVTLDDIPAVVKSTQDVWYVRVSRDLGVTWSNALPFQVGDALLECASTVTDGNFGALRLPRADSTHGDWLPMNMAKGLDFDLARYPNPHSDWQCFDGDGAAVMAPTAGTNCVDTETGLPASDTEAGLLTGKGIEPTPARLATPTNPDCGRPDQTIDFGGSIHERTFNNDTLDCFVDSGATSSYQTAGYSGPAVISTDIFDSPRFTWVPVFGVDTSSGGSGHYQIVDFRPAFITGPDDPANNEYNGLGFQSTGGALTLRSVKVVFFNAKALPESMSGGPTMTYIGVGTKVIVLTD